MSYDVIINLIKMALNLLWVQDQRGFIDDSFMHKILRSLFTNTYFWSEEGY